MAKKTTRKKAPKISKKQVKSTKAVKTAKSVKAVQNAKSAKTLKSVATKKTSRFGKLFKSVRRNKSVKSTEGKKNKKRRLSITIDLSKVKPYLTPISVLIAGVLISCSLILSFSDYSFNLPLLSKAKLECDSTDTLSKDCLKQYAKDSKLKYSKFTSCLDDNKYDSVIDKEIEAAQSYDAQGTPFVVIGTGTGDKFTGFYAGGAQSYDYYKALIESVKTNGLEKAQAAMVSENYGTRDELIKYYKEQYGSQGYSGKELDTIAANAADSMLASLAIREFQVGDGYVKGSKDSKITLLEFSDFECPYCKTFAQNTMPDIFKNYVDTGEVRFVFRDFPLESIHTKARRSANAARCANEQGKFFEYYDKLYEVGKASAD
jgi:protein-disulfide isomerase